MPTLKVRALIAKGDPWHSSCRSAGEVAEIFEVVNEIWRQAGVSFEAEVRETKIDTLLLDEVVKAASRRDPDVERLQELTGPAPKTITALYVHSIGGSNGKVFRPKRTVLVVDGTTMPASRTTAHEIGHLFGLEHWLDHPPPEAPDRPPNQLMARTQPGTELIPSDIAQVKRWLKGSVGGKRKARVLSARGAQLHKA